MYSFRSSLKPADMSRLRVFCGMGLLTCLGVPAIAQDYHLFTNDSGDGRWTNAANWLLLGSDPPRHTLPSDNSYVYLYNQTATIQNGGVNASTLDMRAPNFSAFAGTLRITGSIGTTFLDAYGGTIELNSPADYNAGTLTFFRPATLHNTRIHSSQPCFIRPYSNNSLTIDASSSFTGNLGAFGGYGGDYSSINNKGRIAGDTADYGFLFVAVNNSGTITGDLTHNLNFYGTRLSNDDYGQIVQPASGKALNFTETIVTNKALGHVTSMCDVPIFNCAFLNKGRFDVVGGTLSVSDTHSTPFGQTPGFVNADAGLIQILNGKLDVSGPFVAGQLSLSNSDLRLGDSGALTLVATSSSPATAPLTIKNLVLDGGSIVGGKLNASSVLSTNYHATRLTGTTLNGTLDGTNTNVGVNLTGTTLAGGTITLKSGSSTGAYLGFDGQGANASTLENTTLQFTGTTPNNLDAHPNSELILGTNTLVTGNLGQIGLIYGGQSGSKITNNGTIQTTGAGYRTFLSPAVLVNNGTITASGGASLNFGDGNNQVMNSASGVIHGSAGMVIYDGIFRNDGLVAIDAGNLVIVGGKVDLGRVVIPDGVIADNTSVVNAALGVPNGFLSLYDSAVGSMSGGQTKIASANGSSVLNFSGGQVNQLTNSGAGTINISGGQIGNVVALAVINVYGTNLTKRVISSQGGITTYALNGTLADGTVWSNKTGVEYINLGRINVTNIAPVGSPASVRISEVKKLVRDGNVIRAQITVNNIGGITAQNVSLTSASLAGQSTGTAPLPSTVTLSRGASATWNLVFSAIASGTRTALTLNGTYQGGRFGGSYRVTIP